VGSQEALAAVLVLELLVDEPEDDELDESDEEVFDGLEEPESEEDPDELPESLEPEEPELSDEPLAAASTRPPSRLSVR
jgi:hypothetical protein